MIGTAFADDDVPAEDWGIWESGDDESKDFGDLVAGPSSVADDPDLDNESPRDAFRMGAEWSRCRASLMLARRRRVDLTVSECNADRIAATARHDGWVVEMAPASPLGEVTLACTRFPR